jgi:hypothetical protein
MTASKEGAAASAAGKSKVIEQARKNAPPVVIKSGHELISSRKIGLVGEAGTGKTHFLLGPILAGKNVFVMSTDLGGNGLATIEGALRELGEEERFEKQVRGADFSKVSAVMGYLAGKYDDQILADGWIPHVECWDGFSTFNVVTVDRAVYNPDDVSKDARFVHWGNVARNTLHPAEMFFARKIGDYLPHKIITFAEKTREEKDKKTGVETEKVEAYIQGGAKDVVKLGFDLMMHLFSKEVAEKDPADPSGNKKRRVTKFYYRTGGASLKYPVKNRSFKELPELMEADPAKVWDILTGGAK